MTEDKKDLRKEFAAEAEKRIRIRLVLNYLFRTMKIDVTEEEITRASQELIIRSDPTQKDAIQKQMTEHGEMYMRLKNNLMLEKLFVHFLS